MTARAARILFVGGVLAVTLIGAAEARIITDLDGIDIMTQDPNDDNANPSDNEIIIPDDRKTFNSLAPIDLVFDVELSGGTTEYFFEETVTNNTGFAWWDFHFELGFGTGDDFMSFLDVPLPLNIALPDFDTPDRDPTPISDQFAALVHEDFMLWWSDGLIEPGESVDFEFSLDVPDDFLGLNLYDNFTLRQIATVPEPATVNLIALGLVTFGYMRLRRRRI